MYTGHAEISLETVADLLEAAEFLVIGGLSQACFDYLESNLSYDNHKTVTDLAERFQNPKLFVSAKRFCYSDAARDELVVKKRDLAAKIQETEKNIKNE